MEIIYSKWSHTEGGIKRGRLDWSFCNFGSVSVVLEKIIDISEAVPTFFRQGENLLAPILVSIVLLRRFVLPLFDAEVKDADLTREDFQAKGIWNVILIELRLNFPSD